MIQQRLAELGIRVLRAVVSGADLRSVYGPWYSRGYEKIYERALGGGTHAGTA